MDERLFTAIVIMAALFAGLLGFAAGDMKSNAVIRQCEKQLPRDQYCKLTAVPVEKGEK